MLPMLPSKVLALFLLVLFSNQSLADAYADAREELIVAYQVRDFAAMQLAAPRRFVSRGHRVYLAALYREVESAASRLQRHEVLPEARKVARRFMAQDANVSSRPVAPFFKVFESKEL